MDCIMVRLRRCYFNKSKRCSMRIQNMMVRDLGERAIVAIFSESTASASMPCEKEERKRRETKERSFVYK